MFIGLHKSNKSNRVEVPQGPDSVCFRNRSISSEHTILDGSSCQRACIGVAHFFLRQRLDLLCSRKLCASSGPFKYKIIDLPSRSTRNIMFSIVFSRDQSHIRARSTVLSFCSRFKVKALALFSCCATNCTSTASKTPTLFISCETN